MKREFPYRELTQLIMFYVAFFSPLAGVSLAVMALWSQRDRALVRVALWLNFTSFVALMTLAFTFMFR